MLAKDFRYMLVTLLSVYNNNIIILTEIIFSGNCIHVYSSEYYYICIMQNLLYQIILEHRANIVVKLRL